MNLPKLARLAIENYLKTGKYLKLTEVKDLPNEFLEKKAGVFVSLHQSDGSLRGCIGTFLPTRENIATEVIQNAVLAATNDPRFWPVSLKELNFLKISVDVLSTPEKINDISELNAEKYGVIVTTPDGRKGLLLPDLEGVETSQKQLEIACTKANIAANEEYQIEKFSVKRYHE